MLAVLHATYTGHRFLSYLRADGVFLPATVPDAPVHGEIEGEEFDWDDANALPRTDAAAHNFQDFDLTEVQNSIGSVSFCRFMRL